MSDPPPPPRVLFVCTANECRSPFAAAMANRAAVGQFVVFESAGVDARRRAVPSTGLAHARELGLSLEGHESTLVRPDQLAEYDTVLGLAREHAREVLALAPEIRPRLFTVKQFARWLDVHPRPVRSRLGSWLDAAAADRPATAFLGSSPDDDVADPVGKPIEEWRRMSDDLAIAIDKIVIGLRVLGRV